MSERQHPQSGSCSMVFSRSRLRGEMAVYLYSLGRPSFIARRKHAIQATLLSSPEFLSSRVFLHRIKPTHSYISFLASSPRRALPCSRVQSCFSVPVGFCSNRHIFRKLFRKNGDRKALRGEIPEKKSKKKRETVKRETRALNDGRVPRSVGLFVLSVRKTATTIQKGRKGEKEREDSRWSG